MTATTEVRSDRTVAVLAACAIVGFAGLLRVAFLTGTVGSDDTYYIEQAIKLLSGDFGESAYVGRIRYGINAYLAASIGLVGQNWLGALLPLFLCSLLEVAAVFLVAYRLWGSVRTAACAALLLSALPLHIHQGGTTLPDPYLAFVITLAFVLFYAADRAPSRLRYFVAGVCAAAVGWIKAVVSVYALTFLGYLVFARRAGRHWGAMVLGGALVALAHLVFFWYVYDDPFYVANIVRSGVNVNYVEGRAEGFMASPWYYFRYLFLDMRHTSILAYLALLGVARHAVRHWSGERDPAFVLVWLIGLIAILSFLPITFSPLQFISKQTNYMAIFLAPMCLVGGWFVASLPSRALVAVLAIYVASGVFLGAMEQQAVKVYTANARAAIEVPSEEPGLPVYSTRRVSNMSALHAMLTEPGSLTRPIKYVDALGRDRAFLEASAGDESARAVLIVDRETFEPQDAAFFRPFESCATPVRVLEPVGFGLGERVLGAVRRLLATGLLPLGPELQSRMSAVLDRYYRPLPARVYRLTGSCLAEARRSAARMQPTPEARGRK